MESLFGISWVWWLLGTFGIGGTIALAILAPAVFSVVAQWALRFLLGTRLGVGLLVGIAAFVAADIHRSRLDARVLEQQKAAFDQKQKERDDKIAIDTRKAVEAALAEQQTSDTATDKAVEDFKHELPPIPATGNPFAVGPDACRLRTIAGLPCRESEGPQRVPTPRSGRKGTQHS